MINYAINYVINYVITLPGPQSNRDTETLIF